MQTSSIKPAISFSSGKTWLIVQSSKFYTNARTLQIKLSSFGRSYFPSHPGATSEINGVHCKVPFVPQCNAPRYLQLTL